MGDRGPLQEMVGEHLAAMLVVNIHGRIALMRL